MGQFSTLQLPGLRGVTSDLSSQAHCFAFACVTKTSHKYASLLKPLFVLSSCFIYTVIYTLNNLCDTQKCYQWIFYIYRKTRISQVKQNEK